MKELQDFWEGIPPVTRWLFASAAASGLLLVWSSNFAYLTVFNFRMFWSFFHFWRPITAMGLAGGVSMHYVFHLMMFYRYSKKLEEGWFRNNTPEYAWFVLFIAAYCVLCGAISRRFEMILLQPTLLMAIMYFWSRINPEREVKFFFGLKFPAIYLPVAFFCFSFILSGGALYVRNEGEAP